MENQMDFQNARLELARGRNGRRKIGNNTYLYPHKDGIAVRLHQTDVVVIHPDNTYTLNSGGWQTVTTKDRMNEYSPARVCQSKGVWYVDGYPFVDGMKVDANGKPINAVNNCGEVATNKRRLDKMVRNYINGFAQDALQNGLQNPDSGDCWACHFTADGKDEPMGVDHLLSHFEEKYYVPSLVWKAINARGYGNPALIWSLMQSELEQGKARMLMDVLRSYFRKRKPALLKDMMAVA
jgi:hypothetical protein